MITRVHRWIDFLGGFDFEWGDLHEIDDAVVERYQRALNEYEAAERALIGQFEDPERNRGAAPPDLEEQDGQDD